MIEVKKPTTILDVINGQKVTAKRIDYEDGDQDHIWKESDRKATKEELTQAREDIDTQIADKADASDITSINTALAGKASQEDLDDLSGVVDGKASASDITTINETLAGKASQADLIALSDEVGTKASQSALNSLATAVNTKASQEDLVILSGVVDGKADASDITSINETLAGKASQAALEALAEDVENIEVGDVDLSEIESELALKATKEEVENSYEKTRMRNENLITNGFGELGDNTNFSQFEYDPTIIEGSDTSVGAFKIEGKIKGRMNEYLPVDPSKMYQFGLNYKNFATGTQNRFLFGVAYYTSDRRSIDSRQLPAPGLDDDELYEGCELAQPFNCATDSIIYLKDGHAQIFLDRYIKASTHPTLGNKCQDHFVRIGSRISSDGRDYGYLLMDFFIDGWAVAGVDVVADTINLGAIANALSGNVGDRVFPAGTKLDSTSYDDGSNSWYFANDYSSDSYWKRIDFIFSDEAKKWAIRPGTAFLEIVIYFDSGGSTTDGVVSAISGVTFKPLYTNPDMVSEQIETERPDSAYKNSEIVVDDIPALPQSKITNLETALASKASSTDLDDTKDDVTELQSSKASVLALGRTTNMDIYSNANLQSFVIGPAYSTATAFCTELGLFLEVRTPVWLSQTKLFMKSADNVLVQLYNYENDVVIYEKSFSLAINENILSLGVLLPAGRYYFSGTADTETLAYFPTTSYSITHHFVSVFGGELDPVAFPAFTPGTTSQWAGFYQMTFQVPFKALYLGFLPAKEPNANLITGAFYHVNESGSLLTWCFDGTTQISN